MAAVSAGPAASVACLQLFVISIPSAVGRRARLEPLFRHMAIPFDYVDAIDAAVQSEAQIRAWIWPPRRDWSNYLRPGAVCCALSHLKAYEAMAARGLDACAVFEDDAEPALDGAALGALFAAFRASDVDILLLASYTQGRPGRLSRLGPSVLPGHDIFLMEDPPMGGTLAYLIKRGAADRIREFNTPVRVTSDGYDAFIAELGLRVAVVKPDLVLPSGAESTIAYLTARQRLVRWFLPAGLRRWRRRRRERAALKNYQVVGEP